MALFLNQTLSCTQLKDTANKSSTHLHPLNWNLNYQESIQPCFMPYYATKNHVAQEFPLCGHQHSEGSTTAKLVSKCSVLPEEVEGGSVALRTEIKTAHPDLPASWQSPQMAQKLTRVKGPFSVKNIQDPQQPAIFLYPDKYNKTIWESKWNHMWEQVQQLFKLYYKFHFLCPGILNTTFEPCLKTSNFFLCISCQSQCFFVCVCVWTEKDANTPHVLSITFIVWWGIPCRIPFSQKQSFLGTHPERLPAKVSEAKWENLCTWCDNSSSEEEKQPFGPLQVQTTALLCRLICRKG